jgi:hypothetical protein
MDFARCTMFRTYSRDDAAFTMASEKDPTLTILALSWRATDYLAQEMKSGRV